MKQTNHILINQSKQTPTITNRFFACGYAFAVFYLLYSLTNAYAEYINQSNIIGTVANSLFSLDSHVPFINWMIIPYACSLPLFIFSFFIVNTSAQLQKLTHRLLLATLFGCLIFYWLPLRFSFDVTTQLINEPHDKWSGIWYWAYQLLHTFDKPYNQLPSLHVTYAVVLVVSLWSSIGSFFYKFILATLAIAIAVATLFTWQHHLLDLPAGLLLALMVLTFDHYLGFPQSAVTKSSIIKYLVIAVMGFLFINIVPILLAVNSVFFTIIAYYWLISFILMAMVYHWHRPDYLYKNNGKHIFISRLIFAPVFTTYKLMWWISSKMELVQVPNKTNLIALSPHIQAIAMGKPSQADLQKLKPMFFQYQHIIWLDLACELDSKLNSKNLNNFLITHDITFNQINTPMLDVINWNKQEYGTIVHYCRQLDEVISAKNANAKVLIVTQCVMGWSRSVCMLACILAYYGYSEEYIKSCISKKYPRSHIWQILDIALLEKLRNSD